MGNIFYKNKTLENISKIEKLLDNKTKIFDESIIININSKIPFIFYIKIFENIEHNLTVISFIINLISNKNEILITFHKGTGIFFYNDLVLKLDDSEKYIKIIRYDSKKDSEIKHDNILNDNNLVNNLFNLFNDIINKNLEDSP